MLGRIVAKNLVKNFGRDLGKNLGSNLSKNLGKDLGKNLGRNLGKNLSRECGRESWTEIWAGPLNLTCSPQSDCNALLSECLEQAIVIFVLRRTFYIRHFFHDHSVFK